MRATGVGYKLFVLVGSSCGDNFWVTGFVLGSVSGVEIGLPAGRKRRRRGYAQEHLYKKSTRKTCVHSYWRQKGSGSATPLGHAARWNPAMYCSVKCSYSYAFCFLRTGIAPLLSVLVRTVVVVAAAVPACRRDYCYCCVRSSDKIMQVGIDGGHRPLPCAPCTRAPTSSVSITGYGLLCCVCGEHKLPAKPASDKMRTHQRDSGWCQPGTSRHNLEIYHRMIELYPVRSSR